MNGENGMSIATINPATGETLRTFAPHDPAEIERRLNARPAHSRHGGGRPFASASLLLHGSARCSTARRSGSAPS